MILWCVGVCTGEGTGAPLQYSCLENPMDGGAWWAAVHGVAQSWTRLSNLAAAAGMCNLHGVFGSQRSHVPRVCTDRDIPLTW